MAGAVDLVLSHRGPFDLTRSLEAAARSRFVTGWSPDDESFTLAFVAEPSWAPVAVSVRQDGGTVRATIRENPHGVSADVVREHLRRMFALDRNGSGMSKVLSAPELSGLADRWLGLRPVLFPSPYEATGRAIVGHGLGVAAAAAAVTRLAATHGTSFAIDGRDVHAFPHPDALVAVTSVPGVSSAKVDQLHALGAAARDGRLDVDRLRRMDRDEALRALQELPGVGPFSAELILIRGIGDPDYFPVTEPKVRQAIATRYARGTSPSLESLEAIAEQWRPYRSWVGLMLREELAAGAAAAP